MPVAPRLDKFIDLLLVILFQSNIPVYELIDWLIWFQIHFSVVEAGAIGYLKVAILHQFCPVLKHKQTLK